MDHDQEYQVQKPQDQEPRDQEPQYQQPQNTKMQAVLIQPPPTAPVVQAASVNVVQMAGPSRVGPKPSMISCSICQRSVLTNVKYVSTGKTHMWAFCLFLFCCPCMFIPYVTKCCRKADHTCPGCNSFIGSYPEH